MSDKIEEQNLDAAVGGQHSEMGVNSGMHAKPHHEPMMTGGHQPGNLKGNDAIPTHHLETLPAGTAPADKPFQPGSGGDVDSADATVTDASNAAPKAGDTLGGSTSKQVHNENKDAQPVQGQSSAEIRANGGPVGARDATGLRGVGASGVPETK